MRMCFAVTHDVVLCGYVFILCLARWSSKLLLTKRNRLIYTHLTT